MPLRSFVYVIGMGEETVGGIPVTDEQIRAWADEAEQGYDVAVLRRRGRPRRGATPGTVVPVRLDDDLLAALTRRAENEHLNRSEAIRTALRAWVGDEVA